MLTHMACVVSYPVVLLTHTYCSMEALATVQTIKYTLITLSGATGILIDAFFVVT